MSNDQSHKLERGLSLAQATAINMIDMVGIGPFITISMVLTNLGGPLCLLAWLLGALLAYTDGMVWSEMGAKWPEAGGSYVFLQKLYGAKWGKMMAFLFIWQTIVQAPLTAASSAIGFSDFLKNLVELTPLTQKMVSGGLIIAMIVLLYRPIKNIGFISIVLSVVTISTILWMILSGIGSFSWQQAFHIEKDSLNLTPAFFLFLGQSSLKAVYSYMGYYNACHLGGEIKNPEKNIPRSMFLAITGIMILYLCMQIVLIGVLPWQQVAASPNTAVIAYFTKIYNPLAGTIATVLILIIALASLFSLLLGYSRIPYAAALNGDFFKIFAKVHPKHRIPHISLLTLGALAFIFSLLFKMKTVITTIVTMRILIQFTSQAVGVILWHIKQPKEHRPYKMPLFPIPAIISCIIWLYLLFTSDMAYIAGAFGFIIVGIIVYFSFKKHLGTPIAES